MTPAEMIVVADYTASITEQAGGFECKSYLTQ
jgi:hypothetical protein